MDKPKTKIAIVGDSIFDNGTYVPDGMPFIEQLNSHLPEGSEAYLLARDGDMVLGATEQVSRIQDGTTHIFVSVGGNNALGSMSKLAAPVTTVGTGLAVLRGIQVLFESEYQDFIDQLVETGIPTTVCTIYNPSFDSAEEQQISIGGLSIFNDVIIRAAARVGFPVMDLRSAFVSRDCYANPIEPSEIGGLRMTQMVRNILKSHDFSRLNTRIYTYPT